MVTLRVGFCGVLAGGGAAHLAAGSQQEGHAAERGRSGRRRGHGSLLAEPAISLTTVSGSGRPLLVPETGQLFIGAGTRLLGHESRSGSPRASWAPRTVAQGWHRVHGARSCGWLRHHDDAGRFGCARRRRRHAGAGAGRPLRPAGGRLPGADRQMLPSLQWTHSPAFARWLGPRLGRADLVHAHMVGAWWAAARALSFRLPNLKLLQIHRK
jgi:hypothetical protein